MVGSGCVGWLVNTIRVDCAYSQSRIGQHCAHPNESAWKALQHEIRYLKSQPNLTLSVPLHGTDVPVSEFIP